MVTTVTTLSAHRNDLEFIKAIWHKIRNVMIENSWQPSTQQYSYYHLSAVELVDDLVVDGVLAPPLSLLRPPRVGRLRQQVVGPGQQLGVQLQRETGLCVILGGRVKVVQLVNVVHVQRRALHFSRVEILRLRNEKQRTFVGSVSTTA